MSCRDFENLIHPLLDGELSLPDAARTESHLSSCGGCRRDYEALAALSTEIADAGLQFEPSRRLLQGVRRIRPGVPRRWWAVAAAMAASFAFAYLSPPFAARTDTFAPEVFDTHLRSLLGPRLVDVPSSDRHTVKPWFQGKVGFSPEVPDLSQHDFHLVGGRLEVLRGERAVALVYKRREHLLSLFISDTRWDTWPQQSQQFQGYHLVSWSDARFTYWAVSDLDVHELGEFVVLVKQK